MTKKILISLFLIWNVMVFAGDSCVVAVIGEGLSKEAALSEALRDAVRQGAGVTIASESSVRNMMLEYDEVFERSLGYVEKYQIISQGYDAKKKKYWVQVQASVSKKPLTDGDVEKIKLLVKRKGFPKVWIESKEEFAGMPNKVTIADQILKEIAMDMGLTVVAMDNFRQTRQQQISRDIALDNQKQAQRRNLIQAHSYDFKISIQVNGEISDLYYLDPENSKKQVRDVSITTHMEAFWADSSEMLAAMPIQEIFFNGKNQRNRVRNFMMKKSVMQSYLKELLNGTNKEANMQLEEAFGKKEKNARAFFRKILVKWIAELDLGVTVRLEIEKINWDAQKKLLKKLQDTEKISGVRVAQFDAQDYTVIEFESRNQHIVDVIADHLKYTHNYDYGTPRRLVFIKK